MGINKTIHRIRKEYHWNNMNSEIASFVKKCKLCALSKPARNNQVSQLTVSYTHLDVYKRQP